MSTPLESVASPLESSATPVDDAASPLESVARPLETGAAAEHVPVAAAEAGAGTGERVLDTTQLAHARAARREFLVAIEEHRPALFTYCRRLAANVWDAEDLVQETLAKAFARAAETHAQIDNPRAWLIRVATNSFIDQTRRARELPLGHVEPSTVQPADPGEVQDALRELAVVLSPQERAAVVLKDVFDYSLAEIASMVGTTTGAVKSALHRGRGKLAAPPSSAASRRPVPDRATLAAAAAAFTAYDIDRLVSLFLSDGVMHIVGMVHETGSRQMREGSFEHTFNLERDVRYRAEVRDFEGEPLVAIFSSAEGETSEGLSEVWRCTTVGGRLALAADYFFSPEVVTEVAAAWDVPTALHGYRYH